MNKKLLAVAVAGALAAPGVALAQSSVTISGYAKASLDSYTLTQRSVARAAAGTNASETRISDHSSRVLFNIVEDLGGGLQAIGQYDLRISMDAVNRAQNFIPPGSAGATAAGTSPAINTLNGGNNHVGLRSQTYGSLRMGRQDTHYGNGGDLISSKSGHLGAYNAALFDTVQRPGTGITAATGNIAGTLGLASGSQNGIANLSRTPNLIWYDAPKWGGFTFMVGYSTNPLRASTTVDYENDLGSTGRKGRAWTFNPVYTGPNWEVAWSHWDAKSDFQGAGSATPAQLTALLALCANSTTATASQCTNNGQDDQRADSLRGHYVFPMGIRVAIGWNRSKVTNPITGFIAGDRTAWTFPLSYTTGAHTFYWTHTRANDSKDVTGAAGAVITGGNTGATLNAIAYNYDLSKRTAVGLTYARLNNASRAQYNLFYQQDSAFGSANTFAGAGEDQRLIGATLRHGF
jgi:predicted porin